jgi:hypothetical protein
VSCLRLILVDGRKVQRRDIAWRDREALAFKG